MEPMDYSLDRSNGRSLRDLFFESALRHPQSTAFVLRDTERSYEDAARNARRYARAILEVTEGAAQRVGVFAYRSEVAYTATLGALSSGAAFVPLNPNFPPEKTASMIRQAALDAIVVDRVCVQAFQKVLPLLESCPPVLAPDVEQLDVPRVITPSKQAIEACLPLENLPPVLPDDIAYLLFTSGSTGEPKGVPVTHANVLHYLACLQERYKIVPEDRFSQTFEQTFDLSVHDLFLAWQGGACVCSASTVDLLAPTRFINKHQITVWFSVPSVPAQMRKRNTLTPDSLPSLRLSLFCGEPLPEASADLWQKAAPNSLVENLYGPTELTIACLVHRWNPETSPAACVNGIVPIGRPLAGLGAVLVDEDLNILTAPDASGELCVSGPQTTPGYWRNPAQTAQRFMDLPISPFESRRFYRTGDRVLRMSNGEYAFLGRTDHQIKILGHRVELGEVEAALRTDPGVGEAAALAWPVEDGVAKGIVAFVAGANLDAAALKALAGKHLPPYAIPQQVFVIPDMPHNANGKINRQALTQRLLSA